MTITEEIEFWQKKHRENLASLYDRHISNLGVIEKCYEIYQLIGLMPIHRSSGKYPSWLFALKSKTNLKSILKCFPPNDVFLITGYAPFPAQFIIDPGNSHSISFFSNNARINVSCTMFPFENVKEHLTEFKLKSNYYYQTGTIWFGKSISQLLGNNIPEIWDDGNEFIVSQNEFGAQKILERKKPLLIDTKQNAKQKENEAYNARVESAKVDLDLRIKRLKKTIPDKQGN